MFDGGSLKRQRGQTDAPAGLAEAPTIDLLGIPFSDVNFTTLAASIERAMGLPRPDKGVIFSFVSPPFIKALKQHPNYLARVDVILSDGILITKVLRVLRSGHVDRISFDSTSIAPVVFQSAVRNRLDVILVGGRESVAERAADCLRFHFPGIQILATMNGFLNWESIMDRIVSSNPHVVICGMGAPFQEMFLTKLVGAGWKGFGFTCGGYLDQLNDAYHYYPIWMDRHNLRWLYRLIKEPNRMGRRYLLDYQPFLRALSREILGDLASRFLTGKPNWK